MNKVVLIGRISSVLELRSTKNGTSVCDFSIAINRQTSGEKVTDFINIQAWNKLAENLCKYQEKGSQIAITGEIRVDKYKNKDGTNVNKTYIIANDIEYLSKKKEEPKNQFEEFGNHITTQSDIGQQIQIEDSDLPFGDEYE